MLSTISLEQTALQDANLIISSNILTPFMFVFSVTIQLFLWG